MFEIKKVAAAIGVLLISFPHALSQGYQDVPPNLNFPSSPPVYPSPNSTGSQWQIAYEKAKVFVSLMTLDEKVHAVTGTGIREPCVGNTPPIERLGFRGLCLSDSDLGIGNSHTYASGFAPGISVAATWNRQLMRANAFAIGQEFYRKGVTVVLGPVSTISRIQQGGTNYEGYGADPYVVGVNTAEYIIGLQVAGVQANPKQYLGYDSQQDLRIFYSSNIDDKPLHEIYTWPYAEGVKAGAASVMCAYNYVNNSQACQNSKIINGILKTELGFQGYLLTDWNAAQAGVDAAMAGLDMDMPGTARKDLEWSFFGNNLTNAVNNGSLPSSRLDDMVIRVLTPYFHLGQDKDFPTLNLHDGPFDNVANVQTRNHQEIIRQVATEAITLLKNNNGTLPLSRPRRIAVFGTDAGPNPYGANSIAYPLDDPQSGAGTATNGFGSGATLYPYVIDPLAALQFQAKRDLSVLDWTFGEYLPGAEQRISEKAGLATHCLVFLQSLSAEKIDRNLTSWHGGDQLVLNVARNCSSTIVVVHSVGPIIMEPWIENPNVTAVLWAHLPGQESGTALVDILYGIENPSGKLPYTIAKNETDYPGEVVTEPQPYPQINYTEGVFIDYRYFQAQKIVPRYPFGYGLSYTNFNYSTLSISITGNPLAQMNKSVSFAADAPGGDRRLFEIIASVYANITNTGGVRGREIAQLYLGQPEEAEEPTKILRGFQDITLDPGETGQVRFDLRRKDISYWNVLKQLWDYAHGDYKVHIGPNSETTLLTGSFEL